MDKVILECCGRPEGECVCPPEEGGSLMNEQELLSPEEIRVIIRQHNEARVKPSHTELSLIKAQLAKLKDMGYVKLDLDKLTVMDGERVSAIWGIVSGRSDAQKMVETQLQYTKNQLKEILAEGEL